MKKKIILGIVLTALFFSCSSSDTSGQDFENPNSGEWSIPVTEVLDGGPGRDGIPALENPNLVGVSEVNFLNDSDLVIGVKNGATVRAYPHVILDWHEIINDNLEDLSVAITYCPLTGTGIGWDRIINGSETTFGVSGLLYNTNLIPFDRATRSNWSQILNESVNGSLIGEKINLIGVIETDWKTWKTMFPESSVVSTSTGFSRTYGTSPYGDYNTNNSRFLFPVDKDDRLPLKERVLAIVDGEDAKVYRVEDIGNVNFVKDNFKGTNYVIVGEESFMVSFELNANQEALEFSYAFNNSEIILSDNEGNMWNIFGEAVSGPRSGEQLKFAPFFKGFWFSIPAFYTTEIYVN